MTSLSTPSRDLPPDKILGFLLNDVGRLMRKRFEQSARHVGLTRAQWQVLAHVFWYEGLQQSELAERLDVEPITVGRIVDRMQEAGLIERRPHERDRRAWRLYPTPAAGPSLAAMTAIGAATRAEATHGLTPSDLDALQRILAAMRANLVEACSAPPQQETARP